ncbi:MAG: 30S ribosomal protein S18, partial [Actinobacteria bacterium]|nr:30S ribosomal protein S18 [Actinomycetota bacterium]
MARSNDRDRGSRRGPKERDNRRGGKKKICIFCKDHTDWVDYKDVNLLRRFMSDRGKIRARRVTGNCAQHQR